MKATDSIRGDRDAVKSIRELREWREKRGMTGRELSQLSGVGIQQIWRYETGKEMQTVKNYNKLAQVTGWKKIVLTKPSKATLGSKSVLQFEERIPPEAIKLPPIVEYEFEAGHKYQISQSEKEMGDVFEYERKDGIHHIFREERGKWTRTYTDAQLIGKHIEEVEE